jgi:hypothetical protein
LVVTVKVAVVDPAGIVIPSGTKATVPVVQSPIATPPAGAGALRVTVPVADVWFLTLVGLTETEERATFAGGVMVSPAVLLTPL